MFKVNKMLFLPANVEEILTNMFYSRNHIFHTIGLLCTMFGFLVCCCSVCVSVCKEHRESLFFVNDNRDADLHLRHLAVCDPANQSTEVCKFDEITGGNLLNLHTRGK